jgi:hypothetical protein
MNDLHELWNETEAAAEFAPVPADCYPCRLVAGQLGRSRHGTPVFRLTFEILEGEYDGRRIWHNVWLTEAAMPYAKRDLGKLGITSLKQLESPLPRLRCEVTVALRRQDDGTEYNRVQTFTVSGTEAPDPFAPSEIA